MSISSFTVFDINEKEFLKPEVENIKQLRENQTLIDKLKEKKKKFKFHKSSQIESINIKEEPIKEENKKLINFNSEKFTFDSNGKVISKLNLNNNIFQQNFITIKSNLKLIKEISNYSKENNNEINTTSSLNKTKIIYNDNNFINKFKNKLNFLPGFENILLKKKENFCPPSGDNFQLIEPEFGVIVKDNNNNIKEGIYNKKERKLSLNEYHKISETVLKKNKSEKLIFQSNLHLLDNEINNINNHNINNNRVNVSNEKNIKEKINSYSFTETSNNNNTTSKKVKNIKKIVKYPPPPKEKKIINGYGKKQIKNNSLNKSGLISKLNNSKEKEEKKTPIDFYKRDSNFSVKKISKRIQDIKKIFTNKNNNNETTSQISNTDTIIEKTIFKDAKRKIHKRNKSSLLEHSYTNTSNNSNNLMNSYVNQTKYKKASTGKNMIQSHDMTYTGIINYMKNFGK